MRRAFFPCLAPYLAPYLIRRFVVFAALFIAVSLWHAVPAPAQNAVADPCRDAQTTADIVACVTKKKAAAQDAFNEQYKILAERQDAAGRAALGAAQKSWLVYRDAQCAWEGTQADAQSLRHVRETSCVTALTKARTAMIAATLAQLDADRVHVYTERPRWMNVLATEHPDIFWRYGAALSADLDCDGLPEMAMTGVALTLDVTDAADDGQARVRQGSELVIAVSDNPPAGRPSVQLLRLPVDTGPDTPAHTVCHPGVAMTVLPAPAVPATETQAVADLPKVTQCGARLQLSAPDGRCAPVTVRWNGTAYVVAPLGADARVATE